MWCKFDNVLLIFYFLTRYVGGTHRRLMHKVPKLFVCLFTCRHWSVFPYNSV